MGIKKYYSNKDNTITNAFKASLITRGTGSNMGASDILETFVIHGQTSASIDAANAEQSRIIIQFPINSIQSDISSGILPSETGSIKFHLNLYNAPHGSSTPEDFGKSIMILGDLSVDEVNDLSGNKLIGIFKNGLIENKFLSMVEFFQWLT